MAIFSSILSQCPNHLIVISLIVSLVFHCHSYFFFWILFIYHHPCNLPFAFICRGNLSKAIELFNKAINLAKTEVEMAHLFSLLDAAIAQSRVATKFGINIPTISDMIWGVPRSCTNKLSQLTRDPSETRLWAAFDWARTWDRRY